LSPFFKFHYFNDLLYFSPTFYTYYSKDSYYTFAFNYLKISTVLQLRSNIKFLISFCTFLITVKRSNLSRSLQVSKLFRFICRNIKYFNIYILNTSNSMLPLKFLKYLFYFISKFSTIFRYRFLKILYFIYNINLYCIQLLPLINNGLLYTSFFIIDAFLTHFYTVFASYIVDATKLTNHKAVSMHLSYFALIRTYIHSLFMRLDLFFQNYTTDLDELFRIYSLGNREELFYMLSIFLSSFKYSNTFLKFTESFSLNMDSLNLFINTKSNIEVKNATLLPVFQKEYTHIISKFSLEFKNSINLTELISLFHVVDKLVVYLQSN
jgi:hypothetical protein